MEKHLLQSGVATEALRMRRPFGTLGLNEGPDNSEYPAVEKLSADRDAPGFTTVGARRRPFRRSSEIGRSHDQSLSRPKSNALLSFVLDLTELSCFLTVFFITT